MNTWKLKEVKDEDIYVICDYGDGTSTTYKGTMMPQEIIDEVEYMTSNDLLHMVRNYEFQPI